MARMSYSDYSKACSKTSKSALEEATFNELDDDSYAKAVGGLSKADEDEGEGDEDPKPVQSDPEEDDEELGKSIELSVTQEELLKSMEFLVAASEASGAGEQEARLHKLHVKAAEEGLEKSERDELAALLQDEAETDDSPAGVLSKSLEDPIMGEAFDATPFLQEFAQAQVTAISGLQKSIEEDKTADELYRRRLALGMDALAKSTVEFMSDVHAQVQALTKSVQRLSGQPYPWKGKTTLQVDQLVKSKRDKPPLDIVQRAEGLSKSQACDALETMMMTADHEGKDELCKSYGNLLTIMNVRSGDWRGTRGLNVRIAEEIIKIAEG